MRRALILLLLTAGIQAQSLQQQINDVRETGYETRTEIATINVQLKNALDDIPKMKESIGCKRLPTKPMARGGSWVHSSSLAAVCRP